MAAATAEPVYIALGSNLGDRSAHLAAARTALGALPGTRVLAASAIEETAPLGDKPQPAYLNQMVLVETSLDPHALLEACHAIEDAQGRVRAEHWGSRTIDLDIVRFGARRVNEPDLIIPHPGLAHRDFWRREMAELEAHER